MRQLRLLGILLVIAVAGYTAGASGGPGGRSKAPAGGQASAGKVLRVVDGDTIQVQVGGQPEKVRYIGVDTPESVKPGTPVQCYAKRASAFNERLIDGRWVRLVFDAEHRDRYGRLLAYVYRRSDGLFVNAALVRGGYARVLTIPPDVAHAAEFRRLAATARRAGRGMWTACPAS